MAVIESFGLRIGARGEARGRTSFNYGSVCETAMTSLWHLEPEWPGGSCACSAILEILTPDEYDDDTDVMAGLEKGFAQDASLRGHVYVRVGTRAATVFSHPLRQLVEDTLDDLPFYVPVVLRLWRYEP